MDFSKMSMTDILTHHNILTIYPDELGGGVQLEYKGKRITRPFCHEIYDTVLMKFNLDIKALEIS